MMKLLILYECLILLFAWTAARASHFRLDLVWAQGHTVVKLAADGGLKLVIYNHH